MSFQIAIDGQASTGKSTISKLIAKRLNFQFISSGGFYRAFAYIIKIENLVNSDLEAKIDVIKKYRIKVVDDSFFINDIDETINLRKEDISKYASLLAKKEQIRSLANEKLIEAISHVNNVIVDGRDIATKIMPHANLKFFFVSSICKRTQRRYIELKQNKISVNKFKLFFQILKRDFVDKHRKNSPLVKTKDAIKINTTRKTIEEVFQIIKKHIDALNNNV